MRRVHRLSPLKEEACAWKQPDRGPPPSQQRAILRCDSDPELAGGVAAAAQQQPLPPQQQLLQHQASNGLCTDPSLPLLFPLEDVPPSPLQRPPSAAGAAAAAAGGGSRGAPTCQTTIDTLQLLLGPASEGEAMLHVHVKLAQEMAAAAAASEGPDTPPSGDEPAAGGSSHPPSSAASSSSLASLASSTSGAAAAAAGDGGGAAGGGGAEAQQAQQHDKRRAGRRPLLDPQALAEVFSRLGYAPVIKSSNLRMAHRKGLLHQYLTVHVADGSQEGTTFIVDLSFKDQFVVANPTPRYRAVLDALTPHVIASRGCLRQAVVLLCSELALCFAERGLPIPPWRTPNALLARWHLQVGDLA